MGLRLRAIDSAGTSECVKRWTYCVLVFSVVAERKRFCVNKNNLQKGSLKCLSLFSNKMTFCLTSGQSSPDETQRVLLFQDKRRGTVSQTGVSTDETGSEQRGEKQEGPLRSYGGMEMKVSIH